MYVIHDGLSRSLTRLIIILRMSLFAYLSCYQGLLQEPCRWDCLDLNLSEDPRFAKRLFK